MTAHSIKFDPERQGKISVGLSGAAREEVLGALMHALSSRSGDGWCGFYHTIQSKLSDAERAALAYVALMANEAETQAKLFDQLIGAAGPPVAPFIGFMDQAAFWADMACPAELSSYCLATFNRMAPQRQADFLAHVDGKVAA